jgi:radical SAM superfamily enzyme YgiQ (UPF0313 family)
MEEDELGMKVLFVSTRKNRSPEDRELYEMEFMNEVLGFGRSLLDLGLITVAACTPRDIEVEIVDEYIEDIPYDTTDADLVALSAKTSCVARAYDVADRFRARGIPVVLGGIHASLRPQEALEHVDYVVLGEAEETWPEFLSLFRRGEAPRLTREPEFPDMAKIPVPRWDRLNNEEFLFHQIQTTRGCPFMCRFCSVPDISGNTFRFKPVERVVEEIRALPNSGLLKNRMKAVYFVDDNFISRTRYTKDLLTALIPLHRNGDLTEWSAETTLNVAKDEELLDLFAQAGCSTLIIGFESVSEATLKDMKKPVNFCVTYQEAMQRIHSRGMSVVGNFIVGFDTDLPSVFRDIRDFVDENDILYPFFSILTPMPGTQLHDEFFDAGRLDHTDWERYDTRHVVFEPKHMSREQLMDGYIWLFEECYTSDRAIARLERYWRKYGRTNSSLVERAFVRWRLRKFWNSGSPRFREFLRRGWESVNRRGLKTDVGQLLYFFDSAHFVDYLDRFRSSEYAEHVRGFTSEQTATPDESLRKKQWEKKKRQPTLAAAAG